MLYVQYYSTFIMHNFFVFVHWISDVTVFYINEEKAMGSC